MDYKRIVVKVSGERFAGDQHEKVFDVHAVEDIAGEIKSLVEMGIEVGVVIGGGNIVRGNEAAAAGIVAAQAHQMGMLAIVINALALQSVLEGQGVQTRVMSALAIDTVAEPYIRRRAMRHMEKGRVVLFAAGIGNPFFSSDTAGALRAIEIGAEIYVKATKVDGIYTADPAKHADAKHIADISYKDVLVDDLKVMDGAAIALCRENHMPLMVCKVGDVVNALNGKAKCTIVHE
ncbi:MAG: UMP kinase [Blastochloris viridis]|uniref:Uridylate kinase n=1 Tax=Blastochloris viridis TaxID=1079 RepID=A0A6N4QZQ3_BLAVI|nr:MAG: UMP kinase [Blastochloris viridis]